MILRKSIDFSDGLFLLMINSILFPMYLLLPINAVYADQVLIVEKVSEAPVIDGLVDDVWSKTSMITVRDEVAKIDVELSALHDSRRVYIKVRFPDTSENRSHKPLVWDTNNELYRVGPKREDIFVFKWNMEITPLDISLSSDVNYKADIWYWKANRTDHAGYADDKFQVYSAVPERKSQRLLGKNGQVHYLSRRGDKGDAAYKNRIVLDYHGDEVSSLDLQLPKGSRSDVRAKGKWENGFWVIEFSRALNTGNADDVIFQKKFPVQFGVSRYEIAGRLPNYNHDEPLFGSGDIGESLTLNLK